MSQTVNEVTTDYVLDMNARPTQVLQDGVSNYLYGINRVAEFSDTEEEEYYLADALGSVRQLADAEAALLLARSYEPYGSELEAHGSGQTDYAFTGEMYDPLTGVGVLEGALLQHGERTVYEPGYLDGR